MESTVQAVAVAKLGSVSGSATLAASSALPRWYALYTCANHEQRVAADLKMREVEYFLPLYSSVRQWKDRRVRLALPLFPGYVFVRFPIRDRLRVLQIPSVVCLIGFGGLPTALPDEDVEVLRSSLAQQLRAEPHPLLTAGRRVRVVRGPLAGFEGILLRKKNSFRLVVSIELIQRAFTVEVDAAGVQPVLETKRNLKLRNVKNR